MSRRFSLTNPIPLSSLLRPPLAAVTTAAVVPVMPTTVSAPPAVPPSAPSAIRLETAAPASHETVAAPKLLPNVKGPPRTRFGAKSLVAPPTSPQLDLVSVRPTSHNTAATTAPVSRPSAFDAPQPFESSSRAINVPPTVPTAPPPSAVYVAAPLQPPHAAAAAVHTDPPPTFQIPTAGYGAGFRPMSEQERQRAAVPIKQEPQGATTRRRSASSIALPDSDDVPLMLAVQVKAERTASKKSKGSKGAVQLDANGNLPNYHWITESGRRGGRGRGGKGRRVLVIEGQRYTGRAAHTAWEQIKALTPSALSGTVDGSSSKRRSSTRRPVAEPLPTFSPPAVALSFGTTPSPRDTAPLVKPRYAPSARALAAATKAAAPTGVPMTLTVSTALSSDASPLGNVREESIGSAESWSSDDSEISGEFNSFIVDDDEEEEEETDDDASNFEKDWVSSENSDKAARPRRQRPLLDSPQSGASSSTVDTQELLLRRDSKRHRAEARLAGDASDDDDDSDVVIASGPAKRPSPARPPQPPGVASLYSMPTTHFAPRPLGGMVTTGGTRVEATHGGKPPLDLRSEAAFAAARYADPNVGLLLDAEGEAPMDEILGGYVHEA